MVAPMGFERYIKRSEFLSLNLADSLFRMLTQGEFLQGSPGL